MAAPLLPDPLAVAPFKVPPKETPARQQWLRRHGWPIRIVPMTLDHARHWDRHVQPTVRRVELERLCGVRPGDPPRADAYWPSTWQQNLRVFGTLPVVPSGKGLLQLRATRPQLWTVLAAGMDPMAGAEQPVGMLLGLTGFRLPTAQPPLPGVAPAHAEVPWASPWHFTWLLTTAPDDTLRAMGLPTTLALGRVLVDTAIQIALAARCNGQVLLHADPRGGGGLLKFYGDCLMLELDGSQFPRVSARRENDGHYFWMDDARAGAFAMQYHHCRTSVLPQPTDRRAPQPL